MRKKTKKILAAALVSAMLVSSVGAAPVFAASSISGTLNGISCSGSVYYATNSGGVPNGVTATTGFGAGNATIKATAKVCYKRDGYSYSKTSTNTSSGGGTSTTVRIDDAGTVYGGKGTHYVKFGDYAWTPSETTIGSPW